MHPRYRLSLRTLLASALAIVSLVACAPVEQVEQARIEVATGSKAAASGSKAAAALSEAAVAMPDRYSAEVASRVLERGGNAVDAAIAAAFTLAVTYPEAGNIGGGGFMLLRMDNTSEFLDYRETAPAAAFKAMYLDKNGNVIPKASLSGHRAAGIPGTVAGMWAAHQRHGSLPWTELLEAPIQLAAEGFEVHKTLADSYLSALNLHTTGTNMKAHFGEVMPQRLVQPELAATLTRISEQGPDDFYTGKTAELLVAEMARGNGLISMEDLAGYSVVWRDPLIERWRDYTVHTAPPPSSGGIALVQLLRMKDLLEKEFGDAAHNSPRYVHLIAEIEKRVFADRAEYLGDPDFVEVPVQPLLETDYLAKRVADISAAQISPTPNIKPGLEPHDTTHFSVLDRWGNAVANTYTINFGFGNGVVVGGAGFLLNNEMDDFSTKPGVPNIFGVVGNSANSIEPNKRMLSSMTPTLLLKGDQVVTVLGTPGGSTIFTSVFQTLINMMDFGMSAQDAVSTARFHHQLIPKDLIAMSVPLPVATQEALRIQGYIVKPNPWGPFGDVQLITRHNGELDAASDGRRRGESRILLGH